MNSATLTPPAAPAEATRLAAGMAVGLAALLAWPSLGHVPTAAETAGLVVVMAGLILSVTPTSRRTA